ncbi:hypothetical protein [Haloechinothrix salitolerans]|uniref:Trypsin-like serine peptidase n=1 Tax=Haloechinothrix salitolerans TaxID=926830 RepID=A0ABW2C856_9PSEU
MKRPLVRSLLVGATMLGGSVAVAVTPAAAEAAPAAQSDAIVSQSAATTKGEQNRIESYWTDDRMEDAVPAETRFGKRPKDHQGPDDCRGNGRWACEDEQDSTATQEEPQPELGKVFFTLSGTDYVCSGTATSSSNGDVVTTAGHCLNEGPGDFATNFAFVPAYENGAEPYGKWTAEQLFTTEQWANSGDFEYDAGFAVMNENASGQSLTDVVGSYPIAFNLSRGLDYKSYGYPAASPFDGETLWSCTGTATDDPNGSSTQGIPCEMTGGSSGGGWITGGQLNSVNSYKYRGDSSTMYGPYFGSTVQSVYQTASTA